MAQVTALKLQKRNKKRVNVFLDEQFAFGLDATEAARLEIGQWLEDADIEALQAADDRQLAYQSALYFLSFRPRSIQEVQRNLADKEFSPATIEITIDRLEQAGYVGDLDFARYWIEQRRDFRPRGIAMLRHELRQKGIADDTIQVVLVDVEEETMAYKAAIRQAERLSHLPPDDFRRKLTSFLARRGFPYPIVRATIAQLESELGMDTDTIEYKKGR